MAAPPVVWLIDAHVQIFRAYYSMPELTAPDGREVGAMRGYLATLIRFLSRQRPTHVAAAWDYAMDSFRNEIYEDYKGGRAEVPEDLDHQFELCARGTRALGIPLFELEKYEADDVIGTLTERIVERGGQVVIVTTDKDLGVLVSERVTLFDLAKEEHRGPQQIEEQFGVPSELISEFLALAGDAVDNIPGVPGIGAKTAVALLQHFGSIDLIPDDFEHWSGLELRGAQRVCRLLQEGREDLELSRELVRLRSNLPLKPSLKELAYRGADRAALEELLAETGGTNLLDRIPHFRN